MPRLAVARAAAASRQVGERHGRRFAEHHAGRTQADRAAVRRDRHHRHAERLQVRIDEQPFGDEVTRRRAGGIAYVPIGAPVFALNVATAGEMPKTATMPPNASGGAIGRIGVGCFQRWLPLPRLTACSRLSRPTKYVTSPSTAAPMTSPPIISELPSATASCPVAASSAKKALLVEPTNTRSLPSGRRAQRSVERALPQQLACGERHRDDPAVTGRDVDRRRVGGQGDRRQPVRRRDTTTQSCRRRRNATTDAVFERDEHQVAGCDAGRDGVATAVRRRHVVVAGRAVDGGHFRRVDGDHQLTGPARAAEACRTGWSRRCRPFRRTSATVPPSCSGT